MKAVINLIESNDHKLTFDVKYLFGDYVVIDNGICMASYKFDQIIIVDIQLELQQAYDNLNWGSDNHTYNNLVCYCMENKIKTPKPKYHCPA